MWISYAGTAIRMQLQAQWRSNGKSYYRVKDSITRSFVAKVMQAMWIKRTRKTNMAQNIPFRISPRNASNCCLEVATSKQVNQK